MEDNLHRYDRYDDGKLTKEQEEKIKELLLQSQRYELEKQIKQRLNQEIMYLAEIALYRYKLSEYQSKLTLISQELIKGFEGKVNIALDERLKQNLDISNKVYYRFQDFISSFPKL